MEWLAALLTWFAADAEAIDRERPRAAAACQVAHASMMRGVNEDAAEDQDADAALGEPGAGLATETGHDSKKAAGKPVHRPAAPKVAAGCADGSCVAVPRVRTHRR